MAMERTDQGCAVSRRTFLATTSGALAGMAAFGLVNPAAAKRHPQRGGTLHYGSSLDVSGLDAHQHNQNHRVYVTAAMFNGLTDIDGRGQLVPSLAESWEPNKELTAWTFRLRKGVLFHNGREFDAEAVKLNMLRIQDPATGAHNFIRGGLENVESVEVPDKYTVRVHAKVPDAALPISIMRYPIVLMAPDAFATAAERPIGTGPFKFASWTRWSDTRLVRFENYWETDAEGHQLPYLDEIIAKPKREDSVRLTALRTGQVHLIDEMAQADVERFTREHGAKYHIWPRHSAGQYLIFNWRRGVFQDKRLRTAAAHAIDREAIHQTVYYGQGEILHQCYPKGDPWYLEGIRSLEYDPDRAKAMLKEARAVGTAVKIIANTNLSTARETVQVVQEGWNTVGFKATLELLDTAPVVAAFREGHFDAGYGGYTYRFDPNDFYARNLHSKSEWNRGNSGWHNERYDHLVEEAKRTLDIARRKELYTEAQNIVNVELPVFHLHDTVRTWSADKKLQGFQPGVGGILTYQGGGFRTAYMTS